jgi:hypothetical protein
MPDFKPDCKECEQHFDTDIIWIDEIKVCAKCGKIILTNSDNYKIKVTDDQ